MSKRNLGPIYSVTGAKGGTAIARYLTDHERSGKPCIRYDFIVDLDGVTLDELTQLLLRLLQTVLKEDPNKLS